MSYQLDVWDIPGAMFVADNVISIVLVVILIIVAAVVPFFIHKALQKAKESRDTKIFLIGIYIVMLMIIPLQILGNGWRIDNDLLHIKASEFHSQIYVRSMQVTLLDSYGEWKPVYRDNAIGLPSLLVGKCHLKNKKPALVFSHYSQSKVLLIYADQEYYIIAHPGIEDLYEKLIILGAKEKK